MSDITVTLNETVVTATVTNPAATSASIGSTPITASLVDGADVSATVSSTPITATLVNGGTVSATITDTSITVSLVGGIGDVVGPTSAVDSNFAAFNTTTGKLLKDSGYSPSSFEAADVTIIKSGNASWIDLTDGGATNLHTHGGGGDISGTGVVGQVAEFVTDTKTIQAANLIAPVTNILTLTNAAASTLALNITAGKTLTLVSEDDYTLTIAGTASISGTNTGDLPLPISAANGGTGIANGASASLTLPNLAITLGGGGAAQTYTLPAVGGTFALLNAANEFTAQNQITVATTTLNGLILKTSDNNTTKNILETRSSANAVTAGISALGYAGFGNAPNALIAVSAGRSSSAGSSGAGQFILTTNGNYAGVYGLRGRLTLRADSTATGIDAPTALDGLVTANLARTTSEVSSVTGSITLQSNTPTVTRWNGFLVNTPIVTSGTLTNAYGLYFYNVNTATTLNYAIYTNLGLNRLGDQLEIVGAADRNQLKVTGFTTQTLPVGYLIDNTATTNAVRNVLQLETQSTGTAANGLGAGLLFSIETATASTMQSAARVYALAIDNTNATRKYALVGTAYDTAEREGWRVEASGSAPKISFYGGTTVIRGAALTTQLTSITHTAPGTPDYAIQDLVDSSAGAAFGFATKDEGNTVLSVILNLQTRVAELEARLGSATGVNLFA